jgi:hypothetical protein
MKYTWRNRSRRWYKKQASRYVANIHRQILRMKSWHLYSQYLIYYNNLLNRGVNYPEKYKKNLSDEEHLLDQKWFSIFRSFQDKTESSYYKKNKRYIKYIAKPSV